MTQPLGLESAAQQFRIDAVAPGWYRSVLAREGFRFTNAYAASVEDIIGECAGRTPFFPA